MGRNQKNYKKSDILTAIEGCKGSLTVVARNLTKLTKNPCCRNTAERNVKRFPECIQALEDEIETMGDLVELKGYELVNKGDGAMIRYYLSTKFRKRGYDLTEAPADSSDSIDTINIVDIVPVQEEDKEEE